MRTESATTARTTITAIAAITAAASRACLALLLAAAILVIATAGSVGAWRPRQPLSRDRRAVPVVRAPALGRGPAAAPGAAPGHRAARLSDQGRARRGRGGPRRRPGADADAAALCGHRGIDALGRARGPGPRSHALRHRRGRERPASRRASTDHRPGRAQARRVASRSRRIPRAMTSPAPRWSPCAASHVRRASRFRRGWRGPRQVVPPAVPAGPAEEAAVERGGGGSGALLWAVPALLVPLALLIAYRRSRRSRAVSGA